MNEAVHAVCTLGGVGGRICDVLTVIVILHFNLVDRPWASVYIQCVISRSVYISDISDISSAINVINFNCFLIIYQYQKYEHSEKEVCSCDVVL